MAPSHRNPICTVIDTASSGLRLDIYLTRRFAQELDLSRGKVRAAIESGAVTIDGKRVTRADRQVQIGEKVELRLKDTAPEAGWHVSPVVILFEDDDLIAIDKPAGLPSQATLDANRHNLHRAVEMYLKSKGHDGYAGLHQRLDRETSGIILLTKSRRANKGLAEQISGHKITKVYNAITAAPKSAPEKTWSVKNHLHKRAGKPARMEVTVAGGDLAETDFRVLDSSPKAWWIEARPRTGRMHQIRVHLADSGLPILGDTLYAAPALARRAPRCLLHARELHFVHPVTNEEIKLEAPVPADFVETFQFLNEKR